MFGYVTFYKDELKIKDFNKFRAYYCGLCKTLGKRFNQVVRLGLSYDLTFLALLLDSLDEDNTVFLKGGCFKHMGKKRLIVEHNKSVEYAADMSIALMYYKLLDDLRDSFSLLSAVALVPYWLGVRKVKRIYPEKLEHIKNQLFLLSKLESRKCSVTDEVAEPFARIMESLFDVGNEDIKKLGYNMGRFIYLIDALDDYKKDVKSGGYNPYRYAYPDLAFEDIKRIAEKSLTITLAMAAESYEKAGISKNKELLDNIIYLGLRQRLDMVLSDKKGNKDGKSI